MTDHDKIEGLGAAAGSTQPMTAGQQVLATVLLLGLGGVLGWTAAKIHSGEGPYGKLNPAHEDFLKRRVELSPSHDLWMRGAKYGEVRKVEGDVLVVKMDHPQVRKLVRVRKDRVTLI